MRLLKFRCWDAKTQKMWFPSAIAADGRNVALVNHFGVEVEDSQGDIVMQFTGLLDRQGKEIYEGDVLQYGMMHYLVEYWPPQFTLQGEPGVRLRDQSKEKLADMKILGNRYEHPDLLEAKP